MKYVLFLFLYIPPLCILVLLTFPIMTILKKSFLKMKFSCVGVCLHLNESVHSSGGNLYVWGINHKTLPASMMLIMLEVIGCNLIAVSCFLPRFNNYIFPNKIFMRIYSVNFLLQHGPTWRSNS